MSGECVLHNERGCTSCAQVNLADATKRIEELIESEVISRLDAIADANERIATALEALLAAVLDSLKEGK